jgi:hypothetical protein
MLATRVSKLEVRVDGVPVTPELVLGDPGSSTLTTRRRSDDWWVWPVAFTGQPVRIEVRYTQALSRMDVYDDETFIAAVHVVVDGARSQGPIESVEFTLLRLHGISVDYLKPRTAPTTASADEFVWKHAANGCTGRKPVAKPTPWVQVERGSDDGERHVLVAVDELVARAGCGGAGLSTGWRVTQSRCPRTGFKRDLSRPRPSNG